MSESKTEHSNGGNGSVKRNLPSWMNAREEDEEEKASTKSPKTEAEAKSSSSNFSELMKGVVFVLSGFVNPERGTLRSQALEMGAEYQPDWNSECTLLVCAFPNTPKSRQVAADGGTIVCKEWILECYMQRKLVEIEPHLMHAGTPWRRQSISQEANQGQRPSTSGKPLKQAEKGLNVNLSTSTSTKSFTSSGIKDHFFPSRVKEWAVDDFNKTLSWLENQDERPEPGEIQQIVAEGILTCLQDTVDSLEQGKDIKQITEQWACVPNVVEELAKFDDAGTFPSPGKKELCKQAMACKQIYELEFRNIGEDPPEKRKKSRSHASGTGAVLAKDDASYDSDETIEMTEEEIDQAYNTISSTIVRA